MFGLRQVEFGHTDKVLKLSKGEMWDYRHIFKHLTPNSFDVA